VAPEPISRLVKEAWVVGDRVGLDPTLILAIMAVESSFNPFAQSPVGAQGLMQVMTRVHDDKYEAFGGNYAAFDPVTNLRVGAQVLKECIGRAGSVEAGLRYYVGASNLPDDGGYTSKVLAEQANLKMVASGKIVAFNVARPSPQTAPIKPDGEAEPIAVKAEKTAAAQITLPSRHAS
jgi:soluble lytic murein transglycosylase-like protein